MTEEKLDVKKYISKWKKSNSRWDKEHAADLLPAEMEGKPASEFYNEIQRLGYTGPRTTLAYGARFYDMHFQGIEMLKQKHSQDEEKRWADLLFLYITRTEDIYGSLLEEADKDMRIRTNNKVTHKAEDCNNPHFGAYERFGELVGDMDNFFRFLIKHSDTLFKQGNMGEHPIFKGCTIEVDLRGDNLIHYKNKIQEGYVKLFELKSRQPFAVENNIALVVDGWFGLSPEEKEDIPLSFFDDRLPHYYEEEAKEIMKELGWKGRYSTLDLMHLGVLK